MSKAWRCQNCGRFNSSAGVPDCLHCAEMSRRIERERENARRRMDEFAKRFEAMMQTEDSRR